MTGPDPHGVTVRGTGLASAAPDVFVVDVAAEVLASTPAEAFGQASDALRAIADEARSAGVRGPDVRSGEMNLWTEQDREGRVVGCRAGLRLEVTVRDLAHAGETLSRLVAAGGEAARLRGTRFEHADPAALGAAALDEAFADARRRAVRYAELAGRALGQVVSVVEDDRGDGPRPLAALLAADAGGPPVEAGALGVAASVTVSWAWG